MDLSIVTTLYKSAPFLNELYCRLTKEAEKITDQYEIIFVNDGSPDNSLELALSIHESNNKVRVIDLSKNFGHIPAMIAGLSHSKGDLIFMLDSDLEEDPELLGMFYEELHKSGADLVYGVQASRKGFIFERLSGAIFYKILNTLSTCEIPTNLINARLMTRRYLHQLLRHQERELYLGGLYVITGFKQVSIPVKKHSRGDSSYTLRMKVNTAVNAITSFSNKPLLFIFYLGVAILSVSGTYLSYLVLDKLFFSRIVPGWTSLMVSIWFLGGLIIFLLGIIAIYLSKVFIETKQRPYFITKHIYEREEGVSTSANEAIMIKELLSKK